MGKALREVFGEALRDLGGENNRVVALDADLSSTTYSATFGNAYPERFFNVGIAEANMVSIAAGLSACGYIPYACTFGFLLALRATDQIRSQICYPNLNVKLVGGNGGFSGFGDGATHQTTKDLAIMSSLPNMQILVPSDEVTLRWAVRKAAEIPGPVYIRVARVGAPVHHAGEEGLEFGKGIVHRTGKDVSIIVTGLMLDQALKAADCLKEENIDAAVIEMLTLKPLDKDAVLSAARNTGAIVTVEEHSRYGGLYSQVCGVVTEYNPVTVLPVAVEDRFGETGTYEQILEACGLTVEHIVAQGCRAVKMKRDLGM